MPDEAPIPSLPVYPQPRRGIPLFDDHRSAKPLMKAIKSHMKPKVKLPTKKKIKENVKWW